MGNRRGLAHLYVGDGKGKTTAAAGLAIRMLGHGGRVLFCQFLKGRTTGETGSLEKLGAVLLRAKTLDKFTFQMNAQELESAKQAHAALLERIAELSAGGEFDLIVLDEVVDAVNSGIIPLESLTALVSGRPEHVEIVLSGRNPPLEIAALCDYHTDFTCLKHPYAQGISARQGVEY